MERTSILISLLSTSRHPFGGIIYPGCAAGDVPTSTQCSGKLTGQP